MDICHGPCLRWVVVAMWTECFVIVMGRGPCKPVRAVSRGRVGVGIDKPTGWRRVEHAEHET
jgi:hypothetical protein